MSTKALMHSQPSEACDALTRPSDLQAGSEKEANARRAGDSGAAGMATVSSGLCRR